MKKLKDLQKSDTIWVKCPIDEGEWVSETVTSVHVGEDGYPGSNRWYIRIQTDKSVSDNPDANARAGKHWPILLMRSSEVQDASDASNNVRMLVSAVDPNEIEAAKPTLIDIIKGSKIVDLRKMEPLPQEAYIVGMSNHNWSCEHLYNMKHCELSRRNNEYGGQYGYKNKETGEVTYHGWWTMNYNHANFRSEYMFIVKDYETGKRLAELLQLIGNDWLDIEGSIKKRQKEIERINNEITLIESVADALKKKPEEA